MKTPSERGLAGYLFVFAFILCAWPFPFFTSLGSPNELSRLYLARAIVDDGSFSLDLQVARYGHITDLALYQGKIYSDKAPGTGLAGAVVYAAAKLVYGWDARAISNSGLLRLLRLFLSALPAAFVCVLLYVLCSNLGLTLGQRWFLAGAYLCASSAYPYGVLFFGHQPAACLLLLGVWLMLTEHNTFLRSLATGAVLAGAVLFEFTAVLLAAPLGSLAVIKLRHRPKLVAGGVLGASLLLAPLAYYNTVCFGGIFSLGYGNLLHQPFADIHNRGLWGLVAPNIERLLDTLFDPNRGLFFYSPWLGLGLMGFFFGCLKGELRQLWRCLSLSALLYFLFSASLQAPAWGWTVGPRHLVPLFPFLALGTGLVLSRTASWSHWSERILWALIPYSAAAVVPATIVIASFPPDFSNPLSEFVGPLLTAGCLAPSAGQILGLPAWLSGVVPLLLVAFFLAAALLLDRKDIRWKVSALALAAVLTALAYSISGPQTPQKSGTLHWAEKDIIGCRR